MSSNTEEATIFPDGSTVYGPANVPPIENTAETGSRTKNDHFQDDETDDDSGEGDESNTDYGTNLPDDEENPMSNGVDPAFFLAIGFIAVVIFYYIIYRRNRKKLMERESFFHDMDGDKFNIKLPEAVQEYYEVKEKCTKAGWTPGIPPKNATEAAQGPARVIAQALMKRCIADIPLVTHIQKESAGMNKLYSQSMCSVKQWKTYQAAEQLVSAEVEEVRAEADEIEPGWSQAIWRQAMQYHNMLKNRHEMETKAREAATAQKKTKDNQVKKTSLTPEEQADKIAEELIKQEERENNRKSSSKSGLKKGFLPGSKKK